LSPLYFTMIWDIDLIFGMIVYNHKLQISYEINSRWMIFCQLLAVGIWNLAKYFVVTTFLAHLTRRVMWAIAITWHLSSSSVVRHKLFQKSSPLKVLDQWKPNLVWIITRVSSIKIVSGDAVHQPTCRCY
jgi:hypothetical protein